MKKRMVTVALALVLLLMSLGCAAKALPAEGTYLIDVTLSGGSGKASIQSPAQLTVYGDGTAQLLVVWSSDKYDYMLVGGERFEPAISDGHSMFVIPVTTVEEPLTVIADTVAMSTPHEIEYTVTFDAASLRSAS